MSFTRGDVAGHLALTGATWAYNYVIGLRRQPEVSKEHMDAAVDKLQTNLTFLDGKVTALQEKAASFRREASVQYKAGNKTAAVHRMRLLKMYVHEASKVEAMRFNIESNILHLESVGTMMETVATIRETSEQYEIVHGNLDVSRLEDQLESLCEQRDSSREIQTILNDMHNGDSYDDDELLSET